MKTTAIAAVSLLLLVPGPVVAQEIHVLTDKQGLQTYTNVPASQRKENLRVTDEGGVKVYSNLLPRRKSRSNDEAEPATQAPASEPAPAEQEPPLRQDQIQDLVPPAETPAANGQWVNTSQDGWLYMPYGDQYVSEGSPGDENPYAYVYERDYGWTWLAAPWIWGWGPYPYFGALGPGRFGWYSGLVHAGYGWGGYRGGGASRAGYARAGGGYGRGYGRSFGGGFQAGGRVGGASFGAHRGYSGGGGIGGGHGGGFGGGRAGGGGRGGHR